MLLIRCVDRHQFTWFPTATIGYGPLVLDRLRRRRCQVEKEGDEVIESEADDSDSALQIGFDPDEEPNPVMLVGHAGAWDPWDNPWDMGGDHVLERLSE